ncbi:MAG: amino acid adenylation domain-containing protein [Aquabacterium sp.]
MNQSKEHQLAQRFAALDLDARRGFLRKLADAGLNFAELPIPVADRSQPLPVSYAQRGLWLTWAMDPTSPAYNMAGVMHLHGRIDEAAWQQALTDLVARHEALRTTFVAGPDGEAMQHILPETHVALPCIDLQHEPSAERLSSARQQAQAFAEQAFQLDRDLPLRACLFKLDEEAHLLVLAVHHIVADGWSVQILVDELSALYTARVQGKAANLKPLPIQAADHAAWQRNWLSAGEMDRQLAYWRAQLGTEHEPLALPLDRPRGHTDLGSQPAGSHVIELEGGLSDRLRSLARANEASLYMLMLSLLDTVLHRFTGQSDLRVGSPIATRQRVETHGLVGYLTNVQVIRVQPDARQPFTALLAQVRRAVLEAQAHQDIPFDMLVDALQPERVAGVHPIFQVKCTEQPEVDDERRFAGLRATLDSLSAGASHFDLSFDFADRPQGIRGVFTYDPALFDARTVASMGEVFVAFARQIADKPSRPLFDLRLPGTPDILAGRDTSPQHEDVLQAWSQSVHAQPDRIAIRHEDSACTFAQLDAQAELLAHTLRAHGVGPEVRVALHAERGCEFALGVLAVLKAGGAYVPLDPQLPADRLAYQCKDSGARLILSATAITWPHDIQTMPLVFEPAHVVSSAQPHPASVHPTQAHRAQTAYLIYTSGSTGQPKAVAVTRGALMHYVDGVLEAMALPETATSMAMVSTVAADLGHTTFYGALCSGRTLHLIAAERAFDPDRFGQYMREHQVDVLKIVPSHLQALLQAAEPHDVLPRQLLVVGGEATSWRLLDRIVQLAPACRVLNHYGPTETTVGVLTQPAEQASRQAATLALGLPLPRVRVCVLDGELNPVPPGVPGELYLGGPGVSRGYERRPALSAERFIPDPWSGQGARLYRSGDRVRQLPDGTLAFLGRQDDQVKIRGYRVEPDEVRQALLAQAMVREAVVTVGETDDGRAQLCAYLVPQAGASIDTAALKNQLGLQLPDYMVPAVLAVLEALPLTANGKLDRKALPSAQAGAAQRDHEAPQGEIETALAAVWADVLRVERVGRRDNFFELGGDSILSLQIVARARKAGWKITPKQLFDKQNIAELAPTVTPCEPPARSKPAPVLKGRLIDHLDAAAIEALPFKEADIEDVYPLTPMQEGMLFHALEAPGSGLYVNQMNVEVEGLDEERMSRSWQAMVARHPILRTAILMQSGLKRPLQVVLRHAEAAVTRLDWQDQPDLAEQIASHAKAELEADIDWLKPPLSRLTLIRTSDQTHQLIWTQHHVLLDGWGDAMLIGDLLRHYAGEALPPAGPAYGDYVRWLDRQDPQATEAFWKQALQGLDGPTLLAQAAAPSSAPHASPQAGYNKIYTRLDAQETQALQAFAKQERVTLNTIVQAAWALLLQRHTGKDHVVFGATVAGRPPSLAGSDAMLGLFINTIPIPVTRRPGQRVGDWLRTVQDTNLGLREHEHASLADIQRWSGSAGRPLFDSIVVFENYPVDQALIGGERCGLHFGPVQSAGLTGYAMDIQVVVGETMDIEYCHGLRDIGDAFAASLRDDMAHLLRQMMQDAQRPAGELNWLDDAARSRMLAWGRHPVSAPDAPAAQKTHQPVHQIIEAHARSTPQAIALLMGEEEVSYAELNARANRLAHRLRREGIGHETLVGVSMARSLDVIVVLLAILKTGGAYVPLDPDYPADRLAYMAKDSGLALLITQSSLQDKLKGVSDKPLLLVDQMNPSAEPDTDLGVPMSEHHLAYVIYTSGSTGRPKGVAVSHGPLSMHCRATAGIYGMTPRSRELLFMSFSFDGAHERWLTALTSGAGLAIRDNELWTTEQTHEALHRYGITHAAFPPAYLGQVAEWAADRDDPPPVELYVFGGEAMPKASYDRVRQTLKPRLLINGYGPTETVVTPLIWRTPASETFDCAYAPIGRPVGERTAYVLDADLQPVPQGAVGELFIGGYGLARGYVGRPDLTAERFIADPFDAGGGRLYRTGDLVRWMPDGQIEYIGRADHQVKVRGFRIELGEIETQLRQAPGVLDAAVIAMEGTAGRQLVAYLVPVASMNADASHSPFSERVRQHLSSNLPDYMVPAHLVVLPALPRLISGKLDRAALPEPGTSTASAYVAPSTPEARQLAAIWQDVLGVPQVGQTDNFFELGGDSLLSLKVIAKVRGLANPKLSFKLRDLMQRPTITGLLGLEPTDGAPGAASRMTGLQALNQVVSGPRPLFCLHAGMGTTFDYQPLARRLHGQRTVYGMACRTLLDVNHRDASLSQMADDYAQMIRGTQTQGPYSLLGWSLGGTLAAMVAARLEQCGQRVDFVGLVDPFVPAAEDAMPVDWWDELTAFASVVMADIKPDQMDAVRREQAAMLATWPTLAPQAQLDRVSHILEALLAKLRPSTESSSVQGGGGIYAELGAEALAGMFLAARHLRALSLETDAVPSLNVTPSCWWRADRVEAHRQALTRQLGRPMSDVYQLDADHFAIVRDERLLCGVLSALEALAEKGAGAMPMAA